MKSWLNMYCLTWAQPCQRFQCLRSVGVAKASLGESWGGVARPFSDWRADVDIVCGKCPRNFPSLNVPRDCSCGREGSLSPCSAEVLKPRLPDQLCSFESAAASPSESPALLCAWLPSVVLVLPSLPAPGQRSGNKLCNTHLKRTEQTLVFLVLGYLALQTTPWPSDGTPRSCRRTETDKHRIQLWRGLCRPLRKADWNAIPWESLLIFIDF